MHDSKLGHLTNSRYYLFLPNHNPPLFLVIKGSDIDRSIKRDNHQQMKEAIFKEYKSEDDFDKLSEDSIDLSLGGGAMYAPNKLGEGGFALHGFSLPDRRGKQSHTLLEFKSSSSDGLETMVEKIDNIQKGAANDASVKRGRDVGMGLDVGAPAEYKNAFTKNYYKIVRDELIAQQKMPRRPNTGKSTIFLKGKFAM